MAQQRFGTFQQDGSIFADAPAADWYSLDAGRKSRNTTARQSRDRDLQGHW